MTNVGKVQGTTVAYLGQGKSEVKFVPQGESATFKFGSNKVATDDNFYSGMGLNLSTQAYAAKAAEPQGAEDDKKAEDKADKAGKDGASVTVGDGNGTTIIIIGDHNEVNVGETGKTKDPDEVEEEEDAGEADEGEEAEQPAVQDPNQKIIEGLKDVIRKLLELIGVQPAEAEEKAEEVEEEEKPDKTEKPEDGKKAETPEKPEAPVNQNQKIIEGLKEVIKMLLDLIQYQEPKKADKAKEDKEKEEETEKAE